MDPLVPDHIEQLRPYQPGKPIEELERELGIQGAIKLASNESPMGPSPEVARVIGAMASSTHRYPDADKFALRRALAEHHGCSPREIAVGNGSNELIDLICRTFATPDDHAVLGDPSFVCYSLGCKGANVPFTAVPLRKHIAWDVDALLEAVRPETKLLFLANPNNPTGAYVGGEALERLLRELPPRVVAVVDEAYVDFVDARDYTSALEMRGLRDRLIVLRTFSKAYGLAGMRVGYGIGPPSPIDYLDRMRAPFNVGSLAQEAARAALSDPAHVRRYVELNREQRARVAQSLETRGVSVAASQANFVLADTGRPASRVYDRLLRRGVIVRPMQPPIDTCLRITIGLPEENDRMLEAMDEVLQEPEGA